jgi:tRNA threonylcarbamoyladenosine biosynthesis protein TsaB
MAQVSQDDFAGSTWKHSARMSDGLRMKILALEFSTDRRSVAVVSGGKVLGAAEQTESRTTRALGMVESALREARIEREEIEIIAVGTGPGSYTGIRAAIAMAQGWQLARTVRLLGISSMECLAARSQAEGLRGEVHFATDAQRGEFYLAAYALDDSDHREVAPLRLVEKAEVTKLIEAGSTVAGPEVTKWFPTARVVFPDASTLGQLAEDRTDYFAGELLAPIYLRADTFVKAQPPRVLPK